MNFSSAHNTCEGAVSRGRPAINSTAQHQIAFQRDCPNVHSHQQCMKDQCAPQPHQHLVLADFRICANLMCMEQCIVRVSICASLNSNEPKHFSICVLAIHTPLFGIMSFGYFSPGIFFVLIDTQYLKRQTNKKTKQQKNYTQILTLFCFYM